MDHPPFPTLASTVAAAPGWERTFGHPSVRNWGTQTAPAPTCALVRGQGSAHGVAHLIERRFVDAIVSREASDPIEIGVRVDDSGLRAYTWPMTTPWSDWNVERLAEAARLNIAAGGGPMGDAVDYVSGVVQALASHDRHDRTASDYLAACDASFQRPDGKDLHP